MLHNYFKKNEIMNALKDTYINSILIPHAFKNQSDPLLIDARQSILCRVPQFVRAIQIIRSVQCVFTTIPILLWKV